MKKFMVFFSFIILITACFTFKISAVSAKSAVLICGDTGEVIFSKNSDLRLSMASTTKIMTALVLLKNRDLNKTVEITNEMVMVEGTSMGLRAGDVITLDSLLYGMMLPSGNDAANSIAIAVGGSFEKFAEMMNNEAENLGLKNTSFVTPSGLDDDNHYTSAYDLAVITKEAMKYEKFRDAVSSKSKTIEFVNSDKKITLYNHNKLLNLYDGAIGVKTGFTKKSGRCLVSAARKDNKYVIAVTLNDKDDWNDHKYLLDLGISLVKDIPLKSDIVTDIDVINGKKQDCYIESGTRNICTLDKAKITYAVYLDEFLYAPIAKNEVVGSIVYYCDGRPLYAEKIISKDKIENKKHSFFDVFFYLTIKILRSINER